MRSEKKRQGRIDWMDAPPGLRNWFFRSLNPCNCSNLFSSANLVIWFLLSPFFCNKQVRRKHLNDIIIIKLMNSLFKSKILNSKILGALHRTGRFKCSIMLSPRLSRLPCWCWVWTLNTPPTQLESRPPMLLRQVLQEHYQEHYWAGENMISCILM